MAVPRWHLWATIVLIGILIVLSELVLVRWDSLWVWVLVFAYGFLIDADHFAQGKRTIKVIKEIIKNRTFRFQEEWHKTEYMTQKPPIRIFHTWWGAIVLLLISWLVIKSWLPAIAYGVHLLIDAFNDDYFKKRRFFWEVPDALRHLVPKKWRYNKTRLQP